MVKNERQVQFMTRDEAVKLLKGWHLIQYLRPLTAPLTQEQEIMDKLAELTGKTYCKLESRFCPMCGRPLTEEAWAELERKIGGTQCM